MKKDLHPSDYRFVVFQDTSAEFAFLTRSTAATEETIKWEDGKEYPLIKVHISSASHPFYTGEEKIIDIEGRVDRFKAKAKAAEAKKDARAKKAQKVLKQKQAKSQGEQEVQKLGNRSRPNRSAKPKTDKKPEAPQEKPSQQNKPEAQATEEKPAQATKPEASEPQEATAEE